jgi:urease accessory protein
MIPKSGNRFSDKIMLKERGTKMNVDTDEIFARNRAVGTVALDVRAEDGVTRRGDVHEAGSLRVRFPNAERDVLEAVLVNTAGGTAGGDRFSVSLHARENARLQLTTAAAEKIYRSHGPAARIVVELRADANAHLAWLPQETILFDNASVSRSIDIELADTATLALCEIVVFGRAAMGERMRQGQFRDRWRLRRGGKLVFAENVTLDGDIAQTLDRAAIARGGAAVGTLLLVPGNDGTVTRMREATFSGEVGFSAWNGFALGRFCAQDAAALRADVVKALALAQMPLPRLWLN